MGRAILFGRLAAKDLRRHLAEGVLLFMVIAAASATLTLALVLHGETTNPYATSRAATAGGGENRGRTGDHQHKLRRTITESITKPDIAY